VSKRSRSLSSRSTIRSLLQPIHSSAQGRWIDILLAAYLSASLISLGAPAGAQDSDSDGLTDAEEKARVRTVPFGPQQVITTDADFTYSVFAADLDVDGDPDVLSACEFDDTIAW
jgi:hypothetical protein